MFGNASPLIVDSAEEFSVAVKTRVQQIAIADGTIDTPFVVGYIIDLHDVPIRGYW